VDFFVPPNLLPPPVLYLGYLRGISVCFEAQPTLGTEPQNILTDGMYFVIQTEFPSTLQGLHRFLQDIEMQPFQGFETGVR
jgi:hypothetical protein